LAKARSRPLFSGGNVQSGAAERWDGATRQACAPLSSCDASEKISNGAKGPDVASADNRTKWFRAFIRQIFF